MRNLPPFAPDYSDLQRWDYRGASRRQSPIFARIGFLILIVAVVLIPVLVVSPNVLLRLRKPVITTPKTVAGLQAPSLAAAEAVLLDANTQTPMISLNADVRVPMASTTKIMTAVVAIESISDLDTQVTITDDVTEPYQMVTDPSVMGCQPGQVYSIRDLLYGLLLPSGDDAAIALADGVAGSQDAFVQKMNAYAARLHLANTHYVNVHGLDEQKHYTSADDLAHLTQYAMKIPAFRHIVDSPDYTVPANATHGEIMLTTTNELIEPSSTFYEQGATLGVDGVKTGYTAKAGECLVAEASKDGFTLIAVVMGEPSSDARFSETITLLTLGFQWLETH